MAEIIKGPMTLNKAESLLGKLIDESGAFIGGSYPLVGRLKKSYGYKKVIGVQSFDKKVRTRIDYDYSKGYHFNFENDNTEEKICILISNMTKSQYENYIDQLSLGRGEAGPKRPLLSDKIWMEVGPTDSKKHTKYNIYSKDAFKKLKKYAPKDIAKELSKRPINAFIIDYLIECYKITLLEMKNLIGRNNINSFDDTPPKKMK